MGLYDRTSEYEKMTQTPISKLMIQLAIPTTITMLVTNVYNLADTYFVSQLGESASGAIGIAYALMAILQALGFLLGQGAGSNISRRLGAKDFESASEFASISFYFALFIGGLVTLLGLIFINPLMYILGSTDTILPYAKAYVFYILLAAPAMISSFTMNTILRFEGKAKLGMIGVTSGGLLNIILDPIFIFGLKMGIRGAGLATALSQYISAGILLSIFLSGRTESKLSIYHLKATGKHIQNIMLVGMPSLVRQGLGSISTMLLNQAAKPYGDAAIAAMSIVSRCSMFIFSIVLGIGQGFQPISGFNYGAQKYSRVREGFEFMLKLSTFCLSILAILGFMSASKIIALFCDETLVVQIGGLALKMQCMALFLIPISVAGNMLFQSIGESKIATLLSSFRSGLFFIPLILVLPKQLGILGIQLAQPISDILTSLVSLPFIVQFFRNMPKDKE